MKREILCQATPLQEGLPFTTQILACILEKSFVELFYHSLHDVFSLTMILFYEKNK